MASNLVVRVQSNQIVLFHSSLQRSLVLTDVPLPRLTEAVRQTLQFRLAKEDRKLQKQDIERTPSTHASSRLAQFQGGWFEGGMPRCARKLFARESDQCGRGFPCCTRDFGIEPQCDLTKLERYCVISITNIVI